MHGIGYCHRSRMTDTDRVCSDRIKDFYAKVYHTTRPNTMKSAHTGPVRCPNCEERVKPVVTDERGHRCPLCERMVNELVDSPGHTSNRQSKEEPA